LTLYKLGLIPSSLGSYFFDKKSNKNQWSKPSCERQKERPKDAQLAKTKKWKEL